MSARRKIAFNTIYQLIAKFFSAGATLVISVLITRLLGAQTFGEYSIVMTYVFTFLIMGDFGVNAIVVRDFSKSKSHAKDNFSKIVLLRLSFGVVLIMFALLFLVFTPYSAIIKKAIVVSLPIVVFQSAYRAANVVFQAYSRYKYHAISTLIGSSVVLLLILYLIASSKSSLVSLSLAVVAGSIVTTALSFYFVKDYISLKKNLIDIKYWKYVVIDAVPLGLALLLNTLMIQADRFILSILSVPVSVGVYTIAYRLFDFVLVLPTFFMNAAYPILLKYRRESKEKYMKLAKKSIWMLIGISILLTIASFLFSQWFIGVVWGAEVQRAYVPLNVLMSGAIVFFVSSPLSWIILIEGKQKLLPVIYGSAFVFNVVFNIVFVPMYDYIASAVITVLTEMLVVVALYVVIRRRTKVFL